MAPSEGQKERDFFCVDGANRLSPGHHTLRLTCGPAGNQTATGSLSATSSLQKEREL